MNAAEIISRVKESILSEVQNNPTIMQCVKEISLVRSNVHMHYENGTAGEIFNLIVVDRKFGKCYKIRNLFTDSDCEKLSIILDKLNEMFKTDCQESDKLILKQLADGIRE